MTPSRAFHIRLNPDEIVGCVDVVEMSGQEVPNMSLSQVVRAALSILVASARAAGAIPQSDGYDYTARVTKYRQPNLAHRVQVGHTIALSDKLRAAADQPAVFAQPLSMPDAPLTDEEIIASQRRTIAVLRDDGSPKSLARARELEALIAKRSPWKMPPRGAGRLDELRFRREQDPANFTPAEARELKRLERDAAR